MESITFQTFFSEAQIEAKIDAITNDNKEAVKHFSSIYNYILESLLANENEIYHFMKEDARAIFEKMSSDHQFAVCSLLDGFLKYKYQEITL